MRLNKLDIENFKSFYGEHSVDFTKYTPGLHFVVGRNCHLHRLEGNGVGKSSLFEAVYWALYGKTLRGGVSASNVTSWGKKETIVSVTLATRQQGEFTITRRRGRGKNSLLVDRDDGTSIEVEQVDLDKLLGITGSLFGPAFIRGQFSRMFFESPPAEQLAVMTDILSLESWAALSKQCSSSAKIAEQSSNKLQGSLSTRGHNLEEEGDTLEELKKSEAEWKDKIDANIAEVKKSIKDKRRMIESKDSALKGLDEKLLDVNREVVKAKGARNKAEDTLSNSGNKVSDAERTLDSLRRQVKKIKRGIKQASELVGSDCPVCLQPVTADGVSGLEEHFAGERKKIKAKMERQKKLLDELHDENNRFATEFEAKEKEFENHGRQRSDIEQEKRDVQQRLDKLVYEVKQLIGNREELTSEVNPFANMVTRSREKMKEMETNIATLEKEIAKADRKKESFKFWTGGFKDVRLFVIEQALGALQVEVNNTLSSFGLSDFSIDFACEKETKSGSVSNKFDVLVSSPHAGEPVPWTSWSGGEYQRLRLACELGISNLILESRGLSSSWEVWDEPTAHLSRSGVQDLMSHLQQRARDLKRSIFVIDHIAVDFGFDSVTEIVKDDAYSRINRITQ